MPSLLSLVRRHADAYADRFGLAPTPFRGLGVVRQLSPGELQVAVQKPLVAICLQGRKRVTMGTTRFDYGAGEALVITADVPTVSEIIEASPAAPYYALALELDPALLRELAVEADLGASDRAPVRIEPADPDVTDAALRLMRLLDRPTAQPVLGEALLREMHYWLLTGRHGAAIRALGAVDSYAHSIARAVALIRRDYANTLRVTDLAELAGMSESSFHQHFRVITTLSPLQFQKQLRLIEARRLMLARGAAIGHAAHAVGYESVPQFTRDYARLFGSPPGRDMREARISA
ncbi:AraC family transcriptional regulator [Paracoccus liaowanqingii]|uniref:AraC family transcriptional regulator n=1 Tax=Paracoccus liaowanqingii TaxID=2560053 RepID=A0A4P7HMD9_9RHOB|nr:AraC family transcriptional regulator [Paracoccus liaowanqingii]QBX34321.1 AraC family transcriptional regulator [Paracoccus liaowanqingii]